MKFFAKLMIALLVIGGLAPFTFLKGKDGKPLMSFSDLKAPKMKMPDLPDMDLPKDITGTSEPSKKRTVYKWKDKSGTWHFTSEPPPKGQDYSAAVYDPNMNVIQSVKRTTTETKTSLATAKGTETSVQKQPQGVEDLGNAYSPKRVQKLFDDANNIENVLNTRMKKQNDILNNL